MKDTTPNWDLSDLYANINDPNINSDIEESKSKARNFSKEYKGKISLISEKKAKELLLILQEYEEIIQKSEKSLHYAELIFTIDSNNQKVGALVQRTRSSYVEIRKKLLFFELELLEIPEDKFKKIIKNPLLNNYHHYFKKLLKEKPHRLSEKEEKILNDTYLTSGMAFGRLFEQILGRKKFKIGNKLINESEILDLLYDHNRKTRETAAKSFTEGLKESIPNLTYVFNIISQDSEIRNKYRKFSSPEEPRHLENEISQEIVDILCKTVTKNYSKVSEFYNFKKKALGYKTLYDYDRYAPVKLSSKKIPFKKAKEIVLESFNSFSEEYAKIGKEFFDKKWIDAKPTKGKRGGAYCSYVTPDSHPYIFLNYTQNSKEIRTLAHELGHGIQARLAKNQTYLNFDWPLTIAETASIFSEMLLFDYMKENTKDKKELFSLYLEKIEEIFATVFRQISMYYFEKDFHQLRKEKGELTTEEINAIWTKRQKEMFGNSVKLTPGYSFWWSYIPHFINTPFYVYAYAFGELLTFSLYALYKSDSERFITKYLEFLSKGGSESPRDLLKPLGVNLEDPEFWQKGIDIIVEMISEAKSLYSTM